MIDLVDSDDDESEPLPEIIPLTKSGKPKARPKTKSRAAPKARGRKPKVQEPESSSSSEEEETSSEEEQSDKENQNILVPVQKGTYISYKRTHAVTKNVFVTFFMFVFF